MDGLRRDLDALEAGWYRSATKNAGEPEILRSGWDALDAVLPSGGFRRGALHEWLPGRGPPPGDGMGDGPTGPEARDGAGKAGGAGAGRTRVRQRWRPPLHLLTHLTSRALGPERGAASGVPTGEDDAGCRVVWVGDHTMPAPASLCQGRRECTVDVLSRSLFVRPPDRDSRVWAMDLALRSDAVRVVIGDASGLDRAAHRRLQLAAGAGGAIGLLVRPPWERTGFSCASTRWWVMPAISPDLNQRWNVHLLRCKGMQPAARTPRAWVIERDHATGHLTLADELARRSDSAASTTAPSTERQRA